VESNLALSLLISAIGMGLVFGCILLFWGLMAALVRLTRERAPESGRATVAPLVGPEPERDELERQAAAAAVAVALARARQEARRPRRPAEAAALSPWQAAHRQAQPRQRGTVE
jgi:Na+-transporting methylmalonyl-CoA/oxaloacetate decarboxylase gamma subunit